MKTLFSLTIVLTLFTQLALCQDMIKPGTYYSSYNETAQITQCCDNGTLDITFNNNDGSKSIRQLTRIEGTRDAYVYLGDGFYYIIVARDSYLEQYKFLRGGKLQLVDETNNYCGAYVVWSTDKSIVEKEMDRATELDEQLSKKAYRKLTLYGGDIAALSVEPSEITVPFGDFKGFRTLEDRAKEKALKSPVVRKTSIKIAKFNPEMVSEEWMPLIPYNETNHSSIYIEDKNFDEGLVGLRLFRSSINPNVFVNMKNSELNALLILQSDGNHIYFRKLKHKTVTYRAAFQPRFATIIFSTNSEQLEKPEPAALYDKGRDLYDKFYDQVENYEYSLLVDSIELPQPQMSNPDLENKILNEMKSVAKKENWSASYIKAIIISKDWAVARKRYSGAVIGNTIRAALVSKNSDGSCSFQNFTFIKDYKGGGSYSENIQLYSLGGGKFDIKCDRI